MWTFGVCVWFDIIHQKNGRINDQIRWFGVCWRVARSFRHINATEWTLICNLCQTTHPRIKTDPSEERVKSVCVYLFRPPGRIAAATVDDVIILRHGSTRICSKVIHWLAEYFQISILSIFDQTKKCVKLCQRHRMPFRLHFPIPACACARSIKLNYFTHTNRTQTRDHVMPPANFSLPYPTVPTLLFVLRISRTAHYTGNFDVNLPFSDQPGLFECITISTEWHTNYSDGDAGEKNRIGERGRGIGVLCCPVQRIQFTFSLLLAVDVSCWWFGLITN